MPDEAIRELHLKFVSLLLPQDVVITFTIIAGVVVLFVSNKVPVVLVALATPLALYFTGVPDLNEAVGGLGDPAVLFIASLFIISEGLESTGVTAWAGQLLIPLVFAAHAGSMLALTGTPVNVLVSNASVEAGDGRFGYFEFAAAGLPLLLGSMAIVLFAGRFLLPHRSGDSLPADLSRHARTFVEQYGMSGDVYRLRVRPGSPFVARAAADVDLRSLAGLRLRAMTRDGRPVDLAPAVIKGGDVLMLWYFVVATLLVPLVWRH